MQKCSHWNAGRQFKKLEYGWLTDNMYVKMAEQQLFDRVSLWRLGPKSGTK